MKYKFFEDLATADIAFKAEARNLNELFEACALATFEVMVDLKSVKPKIKKTIKLEDKAISDLLFSFVEELIYLKDVETMLFSKFEIKILEGKAYKLMVNAYGDKIDQKKHKLKIDVKAITLHKFELKKLKNKFEAIILLDI